MVLAPLAMRPQGKYLHHSGFLVTGERFRLLCSDSLFQKLLHCPNSSLRSSAEQVRKVWFYGKFWKAGSNDIEIVSRVANTVVTKL